MSDNWRFDIKATGKDSLQHAVALAFGVHKKAISYRVDICNNCPPPTGEDGDIATSKGWRIFNDQWGRVGDTWYAFVAIQPAWMLYGK